MKEVKLFLFRLLSDLWQFETFGSISIQTLKGEGHSRNGVFFEIANKEITVSSVTDPVLASKVHPIPLKIPLQRGPKFNTPRRHFESYLAAWPLVRDVISSNETSGR